ncbi:MAG TPA: DUF4105 domain-containing protein [Pseudomonadales bacterium]|nr:DUF4105 domain-containing protein [Pseudomonadales bacterium]
MPTGKNKVGIWAAILSLLLLIIGYAPALQATTPEHLIQRVQASKKLQSEWFEILFSRGGTTLLSKKFLQENPFYRVDHEVAGWELAELEYVIREGADSKGACDFPARHNWVYRQIHGRGMPLPKHCGALTQWIKDGHIASVDLLFVSGYLSNPASTFGHTLINFRTGLGVHHRSLEDSLNYGALVPPGEGVITYIAKGLFGGYNAGFSDGAYSAHMNTYQEKELRAIWRYELNLSDQQKLEMVYRAAELVTHKFDYYFLSENCAYAMGLMINAVAGYPYRMPEDPTWFAPIELIHKTVNAKNMVTGMPLIKEIIYTPPGQAILQARFQALSQEGKQLYRDALTTPTHLAEKINTERLPIDADHALDAALSYWQTLNLGSESNEFLKEKEAVLKARLSLPASKPFIPSIGAPHNSIPHLSQRSGQASVGLGFDNIRENQMKLKLSAFEQSDNTLHPLGVGRELSVFRLRANQTSRATSIDELTVLAVKSVGVADNTGLSYMNGLLAWKVSAAIARREGEPDYLRNLHAGGLHGLRPLLTTGVGLSRTNQESTGMASALLESEVGTGKHPAAIAYVLRGQYRPNHEFSSTLNLKYRHAYSPISANRTGDLLERKPILFVENISVFKIAQDYAFEVEILYSQALRGLNTFITKTF